MITDGPLPVPAGLGPRPPKPCLVHAPPALGGLTGNRQELEVPAADGPF
jgi:hypothetical protein